MILSASRTCARKFVRPKNSMARSGLQFERALAKILNDTKPKGMVVEHNPWFEYTSTAESGTKICCPDILLHDSDFGFIVCIEVKRTWTPQAIIKLKTLYCPVIFKALGTPVRPLVICQNMIPESPKPQSTLSFAFLAAEPVFQWLGQGPILW